MRKASIGPISGNAGNKAGSKVYHVLLTPAIEGGVAPTFYYPKRGSTYTARVTGKKYKAKDLQCELFEVPFVRMRGWYQEKFKNIPPSYRTLISKVQTVAPPAVAYPDFHGTPWTKHRRFTRPSTRSTSGTAKTRSSLLGTRLRSAWSRGALRLLRSSLRSPNLTTSSQAHLPTGRDHPQGAVARLCVKQPPTPTIHSFSTSTLLHGYSLPPTPTRRQTAAQPAPVLWHLAAPCQPLRAVLVATRSGSKWQVK